MKIIRNNRLIFAMLFTISAGLSACTNSAFVIRHGYNNIDDQIISHLHGLATFNKTQKQAISDTVNRFHRWHRTTQLPDYAVFILTVSEALTSENGIESTEVHGWVDQIGQYVKTVQTCMPLIEFEPVLRTLSQKQQLDIEKNLGKKHQHAKNKRKKHEPSDMAKKRYSSVKNWLSRVGIDLAPVQKQLIKYRIALTINPQPPYHTLRDQWNIRFIDIFQMALKANDFTLLWQHVDKLWSLQRTHNPEAVAANADNFKQAASEFVESMSADQRRAVSRWLAKLSRSISTIVENDDPIEKTIYSDKTCVFKSL